MAVFAKLNLTCLFSGGLEYLPNDFWSLKTKEIETVLRTKAEILQNKDVKQRAHFFKQLKSSRGAQKNKAKSRYAFSFFIGLLKGKNNARFESRAIEGKYEISPSQWSLPERQLAKVVTNLLHSAWPKRA